jgi:hypothetical protein
MEVHITAKLISNTTGSIVENELVGLEEERGN